MRRILFVLLVMIMTIGLSGCNRIMGIEDAENSQASDENVGSEVDVEIGKVVVDIHDRFAMEMLTYKEEDECFYSDEKYEYYFNRIRSEHVDVALKRIRIITDYFT